MERYAVARPHELCMQLALAIDTRMFVVSSSYIHGRTGLVSFKYESVLLRACPYNEDDVDGRLRLQSVMAHLPAGWCDSRSSIPEKKTVKVCAILAAFWFRWAAASSYRGWRPGGYRYRSVSVGSSSNSASMGVVIIAVKSLLIKAANA